jgi:hypothetical protein
VARKPTDTVQLKLRFSEALRRRLEREAKRQENSLNAEIISRLEQSFRKAEDVDLVGNMLRGMFGATGVLLHAMVTAIWLIENRTGKKWNHDSDTSLEVRAATDCIIDSLSQPPTYGALFDIFKQEEPTVDVLESLYGNKEQLLEELRAFRRTRLGKGAALEALQRMGMAPSDAEIENTAAKYRAPREQAERRKTVAKADPKAKDESEGQ